MFLALAVLASVALPDLPQVGDHVRIVAPDNVTSATAAEDYLQFRYYWFCLEKENLDPAGQVEDEGWLTEIDDGDTAEIVDIDFVDDPGSIQPDLVRVKLLKRTKRGEALWVSLASIRSDGRPKTL